MNAYVLRNTSEIRGPSDTTVLTDVPNFELILSLGLPYESLHFKEILNLKGQFYKMAEIQHELSAG